MEGGRVTFLTGVIVVTWADGTIQGRALLGRGTLARVTVAVTPTELGRFRGTVRAGGNFRLPRSRGRDVSRLGRLCLRGAGDPEATIGSSRALAIAAATPLVLYVVFERLFQVSLPHGALAAAFGF